MTVHEMRFDNKFAVPILEGEKTITVRLFSEWPELAQAATGDRLQIIDASDGSEIGKAKISMVGEMTVAEATEHCDLWDGHRGYAVPSGLIGELEGYYPEAEILPSTRALVIHFEDLSDTSAYERKIAGERTRRSGGERR